MSNPFIALSSLSEYLQQGKPEDFPSAHLTKSYKHRYEELDNKIQKYTVETGAMKAEIDSLIKELQDANTISDADLRKNTIEELLSGDRIIFLNKHGSEHIKRVQDKAFEIVKCFDGDVISPYETFFLLCAISVHDVGNFYGRENHEKKIIRILDTECANIIDDTVEKKTIAKIAGVHGGKINNNKDTISVLQVEDIKNNFEIKEQVLAAILRFADEL